MNKSSGLFSLITSMQIILYTHVHVHLHGQEICIDFMMNEMLQMDSGQSNHVFWLLALDS